MKFQQNQELRFCLFCDWGLGEEEREIEFELLDFWTVLTFCDLDLKESEIDVDGWYWV